MNKQVSLLLNCLVELGHITPQLMTDIGELPRNQVIPRLLEGDIPTSDIAAAAASAFSYPIYDEDTHGSVIDSSTQYLLTDKGAFLVNPFDNSLSSELAVKYPGITFFGVKVFSANGDIQSADVDINDFTEEKAVKFVDTTIAYAVSKNASDIHIEPDHERVTVKLRVDGRLQTVSHADISHNRYPAIANNILVRAGLTAGDYIDPKDGEFAWSNQQSAAKIHVRLSMVPAQISSSIDLKESNFPGAIVLRLSGQDRGLHNINNLGLSESQLENLKHVLKAPHGIFLVTGPTGSGKTTTLYAALRYLQKIRPDWAFRTVENPVENNLRGITQTQINPQAGISFDRVLRALLRQDPDLILVGEIRDSETLKTAMDAAMTGHFVMATLHANSAIQAVHRVIKMGAEADILADVLTATSAQRVIPKVCQKCSSLMPVSDVIKNSDELEILLSRQVKNLRVANKSGCDECNHGYNGRQMIAEINRPSRAQKRLISEGHALVDIAAQAEIDGFMNMWGRAVQLLKNGSIDFKSADSSLGDITLFL